MGVRERVELMFSWTARSVMVKNHRENDKLQGKEEFSQGCIELGVFVGSWIDSRQLNYDSGALDRDLEIFV